MTAATDEAIRLPAKKKKTGAPYMVTVGPSERKVLVTLDVLPNISDHELTFLTDKHMIAAARCRMRDAGLVTQTGTNRFGMTWSLTAKGEEFLAKNGGSL